LNIYVEGQLSKLDRKSVEPIRASRRGGAANFAAVSQFPPTLIDMGGFIVAVICGIARAITDVDKSLALASSFGGDGQRVASGLMMDVTWAVASPISASTIEFVKLAQRAADPTVEIDDQEVIRWNRAECRCRCPRADRTRAPTDRCDNIAPSTPAKTAVSPYHAAGRACWPSPTS
jgi:hypothetical protein